MERINVAEILKGCPQGMELDCLLCNSPIALEGVDGDESAYPIKAVGKDGFHHVLTKYGASYNHDDAKCVIFPRGRDTWEGFVPPYQFKDGDILVTDLGSIFVLKENSDEEYYYSCYIALNHVSRILKNYTQFCAKRDCRLATEEEKQKLFDAETKTLEKLIKPKLKVGDKVKLNNYTSIYTITELLEDRYRATDDSCDLYEIEFERQDAYQLVSNKFDINTLVPFESRVLVRNSKDQYWIPAFWGFRAKDGYVTTFGHCNYCIPFMGNEHLLDTTDDCDEYYKTWE